MRRRVERRAGRREGESVCVCVGGGGASVYMSKVGGGGGEYNDDILVIHVRGERRYIQCHAM